MYKFVDTKGIAKGKIIRQLDKLSEQGISVSMSKQTIFYQSTLMVAISH